MDAVPVLKKSGIPFCRMGVPGRMAGGCRSPAVLPGQIDMGGISMTAFMASRMRDLEQFFILQTAIDRMQDAETKAALEKQKKEISERLETR